MERHDYSLGRGTDGLTGPLALGGGGHASWASNVTVANDDSHHTRLAIVGASGDPDIDAEKVHALLITVMATRESRTARCHMTRSSGAGPS